MNTDLFSELKNMIKNVENLRNYFTDWINAFKDNSSLLECCIKEILKLPKVAIEMFGSESEDKNKNEN